MEMWFIMALRYVQLLVSMLFLLAIPKSLLILKDFYTLAFNKY